MFKGLYKVLALNWFLVWTVAIIFIGYGLSPDPTANARRLVEPEWVEAEGKAFDGRTLVTVLESRFELGKHPENLGELVKELQAIVPIEIGHTLLELCRDDKITFAERELPIIAYPVGSLAEYLDRMLTPLDMSFGIRDGKLCIGVADDGRLRMTRFYPCPRLAEHTIPDTIYATSGTSSGNWDVDGGEDTIRIIQTDQQSILAVATSFRCHREIQRLIEKLNKHAGAGFTQEVTWKDRLIGLIDRVCFPGGSSMPSNGCMGSGGTGGMGFGGMGGGGMGGFGRPVGANGGMF